MVSTRSHGTYRGLYIGGGGAAAKKKKKKRQSTRKAQAEPTSKNKKKESSTAASLVGSVKANLDTAARLVASTSARLGKKALQSGKYFWQQYSDLVKAHMDLPGEDDPVWTRPKDAAELMRTYLDAEAKRSKTSPKPDRPKIANCSIPQNTHDPWQRMVAKTTLHAREMLVIADPGTGKSFMWAKVARDWFDVGQDIVVIVPDPKQIRNQFGEMMTSPAWYDKACSGELGSWDAGQNAYVPGKLVRLGERQKDAKVKRRIMFLTYSQAGLATKEGKGELDGKVHILDEVHTLFDKLSGQFSKERGLYREYLATRKYGRFLGMTATPIAGSMDEFVDLLNLVKPEQMKPLTVADLGLVTQSRTSEQEACNAPSRRLVSTSPRQLLDGLQLFYYSADRDHDKFPTFKKPEVLDVDVPIRGADTFSAGKKGGAPGRTGNYSWQRLYKIVDHAAPIVWDRLDAKRKTLVFMYTRGMAKRMHEELTKRNKKDSKFTLMLLTDESKELMKITSEFGAAPPNTVLVTHVKFATGHTFDDKNKPARLGARLIISVQLATLAAVIQMEGRLRRRFSHDSYPAAERDIERVTVIPRAVVERKTEKTRKKALAKQTQRQNAERKKATVRKEQKAAKKKADMEVETAKAKEERKTRTTRSETDAGPAESKRSATQDAKENDGTKNGKQDGTKDGKRDEAAADKLTRSKCRNTLSASTSRPLQGPVVVLEDGFCYDRNDCVKVMEESRHYKRDPRHLFSLRPLYAKEVAQVRLLASQAEPQATSATPSTAAPSTAATSTAATKDTNADKDTLGVPAATPKDDADHLADAMAALDVVDADATPLDVRRTCERVFHENVEAERAVYESIMGALFWASYGRYALWDKRPNFVADEQGGHGKTQEERTRFQKAQAMLKRHFDAAWKAGKRTVNRKADL